VRFVRGGHDRRPGEQRLASRGDLSLAAAAGFDPLATGVRVLLTSSGESLVDVRLPPAPFDGIAGWERRGASFVWRSLAPRPPGGLRKLVIRRRSASRPGLLHVQLRARRVLVRDRAAERPLRLRIALAGVEGLCGDVAFGETPPALPCRASPADGRLVCR